jgi:hypothetical protein
LLPVENTVIFYAADAGDHGSSLATGDFNDDGAMDVVFAAAFADGSDNGRPDSGEAYVFLGPFRPGEGRDASAGDQALTIFGGDEGDQAGRAVSAGDFSGDGVDDIVLGAPFGDGPTDDREDAGEVHVIFGSRDLGSVVRVIDLQIGADLSVYGRASHNFAGFALTTAEINDDASADLVIGAFWGSGPDGNRTQAGEVYALFGSGQRTGVVDIAANQPDASVYGAASFDRLGETVGAGDVDLDGLDDLVLPAPFAASASGLSAAGRTYIIHSPPPARTDLAVDPVDAVIYGADEGDQLGHAVATGDVSGDGLADVLVTAVSADGPENAVDLSGEAVLVAGESLSLEVDVARGAARTIVYGANALDRLGRSATLSDLDGDQIAELLLGAPGGAGLGEASPDAGEIYVIPAPSPTFIRLPGEAFVYYGGNPGDALSSGVFGRPSLASADLNGDGRKEILVASPNADGPDRTRLDCGEARILFTSTPLKRVDDS